MRVLTTPDERFVGLSGYDFKPHYFDVAAADGTPVRVHYLDEGPRDAPVLLCMHGQPSWCYLYRKMIPILTSAGFRVLAPDLVGFGRSDKPVSMDDYSYGRHVDWMIQWLVGIDVQNATLVCQDWGGLIGLRVVGEHPDRFARLVVANTGLPDTETVPSDLSKMLGDMFPNVPIPTAAMVTEKFGSGDPGAFLYWVKYCSESPSFSVRDVFGILANVTDDAVLYGYTAPFPDDTYAAGARKFPTLVPLLPHHQADREANALAWSVLKRFDRPVLTAFSDGDPVTRGGEVRFQNDIPGAKGQTHVTIKGAGHFLQEDKPEDFAGAIIRFMNER